MRPSILVFKLIKLKMGVTPWISHRKLKKFFKILEWKIRNLLQLQWKLIITALKKEKYFLIYSYIEKLLVLYCMLLQFQDLILVQQLEYYVRKYQNPELKIG